MKRKLKETAEAEEISEIEAQSKKWKEGKSEKFKFKPLQPLIEFVFR